MMSKLPYPTANPGDDVEVAAGVVFPDPYRYLEQENSDVHAWQAAQNRLTDEYVGGWDQYPAVAASVRRFFVDRIADLPRYVAGQWFRAVQSTDVLPPAIVVSSEPYGLGREITLCWSHVDQQSAFLSWISPSPNGQIIAVGVCSDGSEKNRICLIDSSSGRQLPNAPPQVLMDAWMGGACWMPDSTGFYFLALEGEARDFRQVLMFHSLVSGEQSDAGIPLPLARSPDYTLVSLSPDRRWLLASNGLQAPRPVAVRDLAKPDSQWRTFLTKSAGPITGVCLNGRFIGVTNIDAPRGRLVSIALDADDPDDQSQWRELLAESDFVLRAVRAIGDYLYISGFLDAYSRIRVFDHFGTLIADVPLPSKGAVAEPLFPLMNQAPVGHPLEYYFIFSSLTESWGVYRHCPGAATVEVVRPAQVRIENATVQDHWAVSADGVRVPYHTVSLDDPGKLPRPALIYAYGAFNLALLPEYPGAMAAFIAAGGIFVHGHIRGGAELGLAWWHAGRLKNKENCFKDLYAIAEDLISKGLTTKDRLAMTGRSNGGLMAAVAATQRPELWRAIVSQVPVSDLIRMFRDPYTGHMAAAEYGNPDDPDEIKRMAQFSPYHLIREGVDYPAVFIDAGATDARCPPWHARKLAARWQNCAGERPVLLRVRENAGHGFATPKAMQLSGYTAWLAFLMRELSMTAE